MSETIFKLKHPTSANIYVPAKANPDKGTVGRLVVKVLSGRAQANAQILVTSDLANELCTTTLKTATSLHAPISFKVSLKTPNSFVILENCFGKVTDTFLLGGVLMANVIVNQPCLRDHIDAEPVDGPSPPRGNFVKCPEERPKNPVAGDIYYEGSTGEVRMYMSRGWSTIARDITGAPYVEGSNKLIVPHDTLIFKCDQVRGIKWDRNIGLRRAKKIQAIVRDKFK